MAFDLVGNRKKRAHARGTSQCALTVCPHPLNVNAIRPAPRCSFDFVKARYIAPLLVFVAAAFRLLHSILPDFPRNRDRGSSHLLSPPTTSSEPAKLSRS
jgi:hypothetical protein